MESENCEKRVTFVTLEDPLFTASTFSATILIFKIILTLFFQAPGEKWPCALTDIQVTLTQDTADAGHRTLIQNRLKQGHTLNKDRGHTI